MNNKDGKDVGSTYITGDLGSNLSSLKMVDRTDQEKFSALILSFGERVTPYEVLKPMGVSMACVAFDPDGKFIPSSLYDDTEI